MARLQAQTVGQRLLKHNPDLKIEYFFSKSLGDINLTDPLWKMPEKGVFTQDLTEKLVKGECDVVVHSWKDLPTEMHPETEVIATLKREDPRDLILFSKKNWPHAVKNQKLNILTSSPRRIYNLTDFLNWALPVQFKSIEFSTLRGNISTRLEKLNSEGVHAVVVAKAAVDRILSTQDEEFSLARDAVITALRSSLWMITPLSANPSAAAQGALAIEALKKRGDLQVQFNLIHDVETMSSVQNERQIFKSYGGGCHQKIGITQINYDFGSVLSLQGLTESGEKIKRLEILNVQPLSISKEEAFPLSMRESVFYDRLEFKKEDLNKYLSPIEAHPHFILASKDEAMPIGFQPNKECIIWAAGSRTWRKLAQRGYWVNGSNDGLGEKNKMHLEYILDALYERPLKKVKLSHTEAPLVDGFQMISTYQLIDRPIAEDIKNKKYFFWSSYSSFIRAYRMYPELINARHSCGPGHTYDLIKKALGPERDVQIYLNYFDWQKNIKE